MHVHEQFTVLCVDDNEDALLSLRLMLTLENYQVRQSSSGAVALELAGEADVIVLDVQLPDMSGLEVCQRIKSDPVTRFVPVILVSGYFTRSEDKVEGFAGGGDVYLTKPVDPRELVGQIDALLRIRQAEMTLEQQARIIDQIHDAVIGLDLDGRITRWNRGASRLFGYAAGELLGQSCSILTEPGQRSVFRTMLADCDAGATGDPDAGAECEATMRKKSGAAFHVHCSFSPLHDSRGDVIGLISYLIDITERKRLEEQIRQSQKMEAVGSLAGGIAHDFNNFLTVILGYSEILLSEMAGGDPSREPILRISQAGEQAAGLTQQLLAFSRRQVMQMRVVNLNELVRDYEKTFGRLLGEDIVLRSDLDPQLRPVKVDPVQMQQVLMNLAMNARDAMPQGGKLTFATRNVTIAADAAAEHSDLAPGDHVLLAVTDTGTGIDQATLPRIFEPFFTTKEVGRGTGLGLSTVFGIVKQSGGAVEVRSEPGQGTTFEVYLPACPAAAIDPMATKRLEKIPSGPETVLLIEDEAAVRLLTADVLRKLGYHVLEAADGEEAIRVAEKTTRPIDLVISDVVMPHLGGRQASERIRELQPNVRVLFVSGYTDDAIVRHGVLQAETPFLHKPFTPPMLAKKVREVLDA
jgi:two-component system, cell cycle sensor histidine kinase and response regulator CckA